MNWIVAGFDWDQGNWPKCGKHGVSQHDIEYALTHGPFILPDRTGTVEVRFNAVGKSAEGRYIFAVFTLRQKGDAQVIRPISARFMHAKEIDAYETAKRS